MKTFALLQNNVVANVIAANTQKDADFVSNGNAIEYQATDSVGIGWIYDGKNFIAPVIQEAVTNELS